MNPQKTIPDRQEPSSIQAMFNAIAPRYDLLNHLLSFGFDIRWRKKAVRRFEKKQDGIFLDIAAGSGDSSLALLKLRPQKIIATDFAFEMLNFFYDRKLSRESGIPLGKTANRKPIHLSLCDAHNLPFPDQSFDGTITAFGIRNFENRLRALQEMLRVLKPNGVSLILELTAPTSFGMKHLYQFYSRKILPTLGKIISRHNNAYQYLPTSIEAFPDTTKFLGLMRDAGFKDVNAHRLTFGAATIFIGKKSFSVG